MISWSCWAGCRLFGSMGYSTASSSYTGSSGARRWLIGRYSKIFRTAANRARKNKTIAMLLSMFPGAGHMYLGLQKRGLQLMAAFLFSVYFMDALRLSLFFVLDSDSMVLQLLRRAAADLEIRQGAVDGCTHRGLARPPAALDRNRIAWSGFVLFAGSGAVEYA